MPAPRTYEVMFIVDPATSEDDATRITDNLQQIITDQGGSIIKFENMGRRALAYPINRKNEGIYMLFEIDGSGREIAELERRMRVNDQIVRYITVRVDEDRRRADKLRDRRTRKASKRPFAASVANRSAGGQGSRGAAAAVAPDIAADETVADET